ncbi:MAG: hypothetical protein BGO69_00490 [Bacteroidetes bacterium 46-16]|nr:MAG: hypothetical protein BGO69_00490 [Bacteroidetes bacterium 46-16]
MQNTAASQLSIKPACVPKGMYLAQISSSGPGRGENRNDIDITDMIRAYLAKLFRDLFLNMAGKKDT